MSEIDASNPSVSDFGGALIELTTRMPADAVLVVGIDGFDEPRTNAYMRMPLAPFRGEEPYNVNDSDGLLGVTHVRDNPPDWLAQPAVE